MKKLAAQLFVDRSGSAAAEMVLSLPILLVLLFGSFDLGNYFLSEHVVQKAVRDAARYGARLPMTNYNCSGTTVASGADQQIRNVARTGAPNGTTARLYGWVDGNTTVTLTCDSASSWANAGVYNGFPNSGAAPVITVSATVPYRTLFNRIGLGPGTINLNAKSQAAVIGA
jgi:Flp pilus assembly protein TadG